ncbi:Uncharacterized protein FWK35_00000487 [Aphis craccivora]|uniref:Uncharacterized protein n=1 Tax=Aphis craccivora TaxID=307492 RepID=A0A6G0ZLV1_APHCR|nr:Uncharacterized protein FWK35_00000487 [Aphis craccivora]
MVRTGTVCAKDSVTGLDTLLQSKMYRTYCVVQSSRTSRSTTTHQERHLVLSEAEETFRIFYKTVTEILTLKEQEERVRQAAEAAE